MTSPASLSVASAATAAPALPLTDSRSARNETHDRALAAIRRAAASAESERELCDRVVREVARALDVPLCGMLQLDASGRWLTLVAGEGWQTGVVGSGHVAVGATTLAGLTLRLQTPVICDDLPRTSFLSDAVLLRQHGVVSGISAIVGSSETPIGVLSAHSTTRRSFTAAETQFLGRAAAVLADGLRGRRVAAP